MPDLLRHATGAWYGDLRSGHGSASTESGALKEARVSFDTRFDTTPGSNPEELLAAAHASCFSMALSAGLGRMGFTPTEIKTTATLTLHKGEQGFKITKIHLDTEGKVPGASDAQFQEAAEGAKKGCPVSTLLAPGLEEITLSAKLAKG